MVPKRAYFLRKNKNGERGRTRTCDPCLKRALLYQLSYAPTANASGRNYKTNLPRAAQPALHSAHD